MYHLYAPSQAVDPIKAIVDFNFKTRENLMSYDLLKINYLKTQLLVYDRRNYIRKQRIRGMAIK